ncbi:probable disease resistance protein At4g27220 [Vigna angularis]|uniref:probable disease resistance protein At4g27220 n=1 Tax=Phaseolus angularis TaxID=3914 RepID=UPI0022B5DB7E|nr:probable disease resistance protein At4g27220 [Vigna angularis]
MDFASSVSRDLVCGALNQLRYLRSFNNFVKKLEQEEGDLIVTRDDVQKYVEHAKRKTRETSGLVDKWLQDAISNIGKVNQLLEEARTKNMCCFGYCPNWIWRYRMGKKLANKVFHLEKFIDEGKRYVPFDRIATLPSNTLDMLSEKCINFASRQSAFEQLLDAVKNKDVSMIGLYGMDGCGKTTLAMEIRKFVEAEHLFEKVLFVPVSSTVEVGRIQEKIASSLPVEFPETEEMQRAQILCSTLTKEKNVFIILDDVWEKLDFGRIGIPSSEHLKGCKILITTRSEGVCTLMDCQRKISLQNLTDEEAWTLFQNKALISDATSDTLKDMGRLISDECKGLPVAIAAVAGSLKGKAETDWMVALNRLRHSKPISIERGLTNPYKCLQLSYDNLADKEAKSLFLLCSVFPEDFEIPIEILTRCAIGLGVVGEVDSYEEARSEVIAAKIKLVSCCLLLDADHERVKMHDIVRDVAHIIAKDENKIIKCEVEKDVRVEQNSVRYLWCAKFPNDLDCSNLEFLRLRTKMKEFDGIFKRMGMLKVLILLNDEDGKTRLSTISFETLTNLRCLFIENYELSDFSFLGGMKNLQSLSLCRCSLPSFPELQTDVAITLKLLELRECEIKVKNFEVIKRIPLLEELYIIDIRGKWRDANSEDKIEFFKTFSIPKTLQRYGIVLGSYRFGHYNDDDIYVHGRTLVLNHFDISNELIKGLAKKANHLFVRNIHGGAKNIIPDIFQIEGGDLDELKKLEIHNSEELECLIDTRSHSSEVYILADDDKTEEGEDEFTTGHPVQIFQNLQDVKIYSCRELKHIFPANIVDISIFQSLKKLHISECDLLEGIFPVSFVGGMMKFNDITNKETADLKDFSSRNNTQSEDIQNHLPTLQTLNIKHSDAERIFCLNEHEMIGQQVSLRLENLELYNLPQMAYIWVGPKNSLTLQHLTTLEIRDCGKLEVIFPKSVVRCLPELKNVTIRECMELKQIIEEDQSNLHSIDGGSEVEEIIECDKEASKNYFTFPNLENLEIIECAKLEIVFPKSVLRCFPKLKLLKIRKCKELRQIIEGNVEHKKFSNLVSLQLCFPKLEALYVDHCHKLKILFSGFANDLPNLHLLAIKGLNLIMIPNIREIELRDFDNARYLFKLSIASSLMLEILRIEECPGLEHIIDTDYEYVKENLKAIFPNLRELSVRDCDQLKYIGQYPVANQDYKETHSFLTIGNAPSFETTKFR